MSFSDEEAPRRRGQCLRVRGELRIVAPREVESGDLAMIRFDCECGHTIAAKEDAAGGRGKCPNCGRFVTIPASSVAYTLPSREQSKTRDVASMGFAYKMVPLPPVVDPARDRPLARQAAEGLQETVEKHAVGGWEFFRVDTVEVEVQPGCLGVLLAQGPRLVNYQVVTFRRPHVATSGY